MSEVTNAKKTPTDKSNTNVTFLILQMVT